MITVYVDGLAEPNPGVGTFGYVIYEDGKKISEKGEFIGEDVTNNYAEYFGLVSALEDLIKKGLVADIIVRSDSKLLVSQMKGEAKGKGGSYLERYKEALDLSKKFESVVFEWVPRDANQEADLLSRIAYEKHRKSIRKEPL